MPPIRHLPHEQAESARRLIGFLIRAGIFRNREPYVSVWKMDDGTSIGSFWAAGEELIKYLLEIGAVRQEGGRTVSSLEESQIKRWVREGKRDDLDVERAFKTLIYHLSADMITLGDPQFFVACEPCANALLQNDLPPISQQELDELMEDLFYLGYMRRVGNGYRPTVRAASAFDAAYLDCDLS